LLYEVNFRWRESPVVVEEHCCYFSYLGICDPTVVCGTTKTVPA